MGRAIGRWYRQYFRIKCHLVTPRNMRLKTYGTGSQELAGCARFAEADLPLAYRGANATVRESRVGAGDNVINGPAGRGLRGRVLEQPVREDPQVKGAAGIPLRPPCIPDYQIRVTTPAIAIVFALWITNVSVLATSMSTRWLKSR
jgi:hypothetical protein